MEGSARFVTCALWFAALAACAPLTARQPLFEPASARSEVVEGVWLSAKDDCLRAFERSVRLPDDCLAIEIRRTSTGHWIVRAPAPGVEGRWKDDELVMRGVLAPATERRRGPESPPLYVFERYEPEGSLHASIRYDAIIPIGDAPVRSIYLVAEIGCDEVLRDGPIEGVAEHTNSETLRRECVAENPRAVRAAVRRAVIESLGDLESRRLVFVRE